MGCVRGSEVKTRGTVAVAIKVSIGKYPMTVPFNRFFTEGIEGNDFSILPIEIRHATVLSTLPITTRTRLTG